MTRNRSATEDEAPLSYEDLEQRYNNLRELLEKQKPRLAKLYERPDVSWWGDGNTPWDLACNEVQEAYKAMQNANRWLMGSSESDDADRIMSACDELLGRLNDIRDAAIERDPHNGDCPW
jgi:hypothetical protein